MTEIRLKIADIIIQLKSRFPMELLKKEDSWRYDNFIYKGIKQPHIVLGIKMVKKLPKVKVGTKRIFLTRHPDSKSSNWALFKRNIGYILRQYVSTKKQHITLTPGFNRGLFNLETDKQNNWQWGLTDIIYDALQIILINYVTNRDGMFVHAIGLKDIDCRGFLFVGKSGRGKSTTARLWHKFSRATVLNDDRIIIRKQNGRFFIYGCPWHGDFSDYLISKIDAAGLKSIFFISPAKTNSARMISQKRAFSLLYPCLFPTFWDKQGIEKMIIFCQDLLNNIPCFALGFRNDKRVIKFVRNIPLNTNVHPVRKLRHLWQGCKQSEKNNNWGGV